MDALATETRRGPEGRPAVQVPPRSPVSSSSSLLRTCGWILAGFDPARGELQELAPGRGPELPDERQQPLLINRDDPNHVGPDDDFPFASVPPFDVHVEPVAREDRAHGLCLHRAHVRPRRPAANAAAKNQGVVLRPASHAFEGHVRTGHLPAVYVYVDQPVHRGRDVKPTRPGDSHWAQREP